MHHHLFACPQLAMACIFLLLSTFTLMSHVTGLPQSQTGIEQVLIAESPECRDDVSRICQKSSSNNFEVLDCLIDRDRSDAQADVSPKCHHFIWMYKFNLTRTGQLEKVAASVCVNLQEKCHSKDDQKDPGYFISCLLENAESEVDQQCRLLLKRLEVLVFSDFRLMHKFAHQCEKDISEYKCGRLDDDYEAAHSQGKTIECLELHKHKLTPECRQQILRVAELQSDDFHLDRPLYFACREDREQLCPRVQAGNGRVYRCLMRHRKHVDMSEKCRDQLSRREALASMDYKVSKGLAVLCKEEIREHDCRHDASERREIRLAQILLCLENQLSLGHKISGECRSEMLVHRQSLMTNYQLTPDLAVVCRGELEGCGRRLNGESLHCLMVGAKESILSNSDTFSVGCRRLLEDILKQVNPGEDWRVDPELQSNCQTSVDALCSNVEPGDGRVISCLMDHVDSTKMKPKCRETLEVLQYFIVRDFDLDASLYHSCHKDAVRFCHAKDEWYKSGRDLDPERGPTVMSCLYRYVYHPKKQFRLSESCTFEVKRVMKQRALKVDLMPEIEDACLNDLSLHCSDDDQDVLKKGFEMDCLQDNLEKLTPRCKLLVANFTEEESEHFELNSNVMKACSEPLKQLCSDDLDENDHGDLLECLILNKNNKLVNGKCHQAIQHFQLISMKDYKFSYKFKESCEDDVLKNCGHSQTKVDVIRCLSEMTFNDTFVIARKPRISKKCRNQLKTELLARGEDVELDPELKRACSSEIVTLCSASSSDESSSTTECLKTNVKSLGSKCHRVLFNREKIELVDSGVDYQLLKTCKRMIEKFCDSTVSTEYLFCLRDSRNDVQFEPKCRKLVLKRLSAQNNDFRLNSRLRTSCSKDISKFCSKVITGHKSEDVEFEGRVISCLKNQYTKNRLSDTCETEVLSIIRESAQNYQLDPELVRGCQSDISQGCSDESDVEECLKRRFQEKLLKNHECVEQVARLVTEAKADIQSDVLLMKACANDINSNCGHIPAGHGRQLSCLLSVLESNPKEISTDCRSLLSKRVEMFEYAAQIAPAQSVGQVVQMMAESPARNHFLVVALLCFLGIFFGGIFFGRVTQTVDKNK